MLIGRNGSGKSTLIKILSGIHSADAGSITVSGERLPRSIGPANLRRAGLSFVHQDPGLVTDLTAFENIRVDSYTPRGVLRRIRWREERAHAQRTLDELHADFPAETRVRDPPAGKRALIAIAGALQAKLAATG
jgi:ribose transport system ATP-binding protein